MNIKKHLPVEGTLAVNTPLSLLLCVFTALSAELLFQYLVEISSFSASIGRVIIISLSLSLILIYSSRSMLRFRPSRNDLLLLHAILIASIFVLWFGKIFTIALSEYLSHFEFFKSLTPQTLRYAIPFAFGGLLIAGVRGLNYGLVLSVCYALMVGFYLPNDILIIPFVLITTLVACMSLAQLRSRGTYLKAAIKIGAFALPFSLAALIFQAEFMTVEISFRALTPFIGGFLAVALAALLTPLLEHLGGYVTDLKLIEMSTLDHPLLKELSIQAPGTWNHSMVVGMMVEAAATEVEANPVLARVGAYFHDIGKAKKPIYFVENQKGGENRHDRLSPSMSALIIRSHVKDGIEMAHEHRVPKSIVDLIEQHHGTTLIEYFYNKACKEAEEAEETVEVDKSLYTYPGPKPQTREAGILMLADVIESSSRTLPDLSLDRIQMHVQKMVNRVFASGQLEESDLTLRDLHKIARCFTRVLNGIHHQRVAYEEEEKSSSRVTQSLSKDENKTKQESSNNATAKTVDSVHQNGASQTKNREPEAEKPGEENLKRLGLEQYT